MSTTAYIGLGSNLGDRHAHLDRAVASLRQRPGIEVKRVSAYRETSPVGGPFGQGPYLNAVAEVETSLSPAELMQVLLDVEQLLGRVRAGRWGPRNIDLDLLLFGQEIVDEPLVTVPHPRMHARRFVLEPLAELAPQMVHPRLGQSVPELLAALPAETGRELSGLTALVTGSTSGIGRAVALELAAGGCDVIVHGRRPDAAEAVAADVQARNVRSQVLLADLGDAAEGLRLVEAAWKEWDGLDIWVNNAGADILTTEAAQWPFERKLQELLRIDVSAAMLLARAVGERMKAAGGGVILNMGWDQADTGMEGDSGQLFGAAKAAVMAFSKSLALSLAPEVRVNCLAPGWIRTAWGEGASSRWQERVLRETPLRRWGRPEDVAAVARLLVSPAAAFLTGQVIRVNGGAVR
jgi:2-amino-4-hydroxy-6-hydroxymethyldihydropteridine diphosphokinase